VKKLLLAIALSAPIAATASGKGKMFEEPYNIGCVNKASLEMALKFRGSHEIAGVKSLINMQLCFELAIHESVTYEALERGEGISKIQISLQRELAPPITTTAYVINQAIR
jgi:hypothetical protein